MVNRRPASQLNAWTMPLMQKFFDTLSKAATDDDVKGVVITGNGKYYSAGVDLSAMIQPMAPAKLYYFKGRGRSQQSRWVLAASSIATISRATALRVAASIVSTPT